MNFTILNHQHVTERFSLQMIKKVWEKATVSNNHDPNEYRLDVCGALMRFSHYGDKDEIMGWQIDCIKPLEYGGDLNFYNLQPLNWKNKASKQNNYPSWNCSTYTTDRI